MEEFWFDNPTNLFTKNNYYKVFPTVSMSYNEQLNSLTRLLAYLLVLSILIQFYDCIAMYPLLLIMIIVIIYLVYCNNLKHEENEIKVKEKEKNASENIVDKQIINIYQNIGDTTDKKKKCKTKNKKVKPFFGNDDVSKKIYEMTFEDIIPQKYPPDRNNFANWVFRSTAPCKDQMSKCASKPYTKI